MIARFYDEDEFHAEAVRIFLDLRRARTAFVTSAPLLIEVGHQLFNRVGEKAQPIMRDILDHDVHEIAFAPIRRADRRG